MKSARKCVGDLNRRSWSKRDRLCLLLASAYIASRETIANTRTDAIGALARPNLRCRLPALRHDYSEGSTAYVAVTV